MTREEARTIVEALHRAVVTERPYASREVLVTRSPGVRHVSARWHSFYADGATEEEALAALGALVRQEAEDVAAGLVKRARSARDVARHADEWDARAARIRALLATPADARQPELFDLGGSR